jgi:hypothetical protein
MLYPKSNHKVHEYNQKSRVETAGYIPQHIRIQNLIDAGKRLITSRSQAYDYPDGNYDEDAPIPDITRRPNYDMADAYQDARGINDRLASARIRAEAEAEKVKNSTKLDEKSEKTTAE